MPLTASEHQKISALQQISRLVSQAQSVAGNQQVLTNIVNSAAPLIQKWERSDPEFAQLGILLRQARMASPGNPTAFASLAGQVQRMIGIVRGSLAPRVNAAGEKVIWDPVRGLVSSPMFEAGEPLTPQSVYGWRGSKKYPMGKAFPDYLSIEGWEAKKFLSPAVLVLAVIVGSSLGTYVLYASQKGKWPFKD